MLRHLNPSEGERGLLVAFVGIAMFSIAIALTTKVQLDTGSILTSDFGRYDAWFVISGLCGGVAGFYLTLKWFGHPGRAGWIRALIGVLVFSFVSSIIAGTLVLPLYGTMFGPFTLLMVLISTPMLALLWTCAILIAHRLVWRWRVERNSLFEPLAKSGRGGMRRA